MSDRFDLENRINQLSQFSSILRDLEYSIIENNLDTDAIVNSIEGVASAIDNYEVVMFDIYRQTFQLDQYNQQDQIDYCYH